MKYIALPILSEAELQQLLNNTSQEGECKLWNGYSTRKGYGGVRYKGKSFLVTRLILAGMTNNNGLGLLACHTCDNPICVNPKHLFWGTHSDNTKDCVSKGRWINPSKSAEKTICKNGHSLGPENLYPTKNGKKACKECVRQRSKVSYYRKLEKLKQVNHET